MKNSEFLSVVKDLSSINMGIEGHPYDEAIDALEDKILTNQYRIAVVGDFSTGKSTFINALLGEELLYTSTKEATGVITTIQYDEIPHAQICKKTDYDLTDKIIEDINLESNDGRERLNRYLDIENKTKVDRIDIFFPIQGVDRDIIFFDTPGIEKLSRDQMLMTKKVIAESNAVIFLITKKGFTEQALKVISSEHDVIGKISTKDMMVVMTHIGEIYESKEELEAQIQIERVVGEAKQQLANKGIIDMEVFPLDSRDYLWGINNNVYNKEQEKRNIVLNGFMLSQEEYRKRSHFDDFKTKLYKFLDRDNLQKSRNNDIKNNILLITEAIEIQLQEQEKSGQQNNAYLKEQLEKQIEMACYNQRKFYNRLIRQLQNHMDDFLENVERDSKMQEKKNINILSLIQYTFQKLDDINEENVQMCVDETVLEIEKFAEKIEKETNNHIKIICNSFVSNVFSEEFQKIFNKFVDVQIENPVCDFSLVLKKDDYDVESVVNDADVEQVEQEKQQEKNIIIELEKNINRLIVSCNERNQKYRRQYDELENWYNSEISKLGKRPKAVQKYRKEKRTKGHLFWKKTWYEDVPDGMDNSAGIEWDRKQRQINKTYEQKLEILAQNEKAIEGDKWYKNQLENELKKHKSKLRHLGEKIKKYREYIEEGKKQYTEEYIAEKKEEVASYCDMIREGLLGQVCETVRTYIYDSKKEIESAIKTELNYQVEKFRNELNEKNQLLSNKIKLTEETKRGIHARLRTIKEEIKHGQVIYGDVSDKGQLTSRVAQSRFPKLICKNFPKRQLFSNIQKHEASEDVIRKALIILVFYEFYATALLNAEKNASGDVMDFGEEYEDFKVELDDILLECGYVQMYVRNPFDFFIVYCAKTCNPLDTFRTLIAEYQLDVEE